MKRPTILVFIILGIISCILIPFLALSTLTYLALSALDLDDTDETHGIVSICDQELNVSQPHLWKNELALQESVPLVSLPEKEAVVPDTLKSYLFIGDINLVAVTPANTPVANQNIFTELRVVDGTRVDLPINNNFYAGTLTKEGIKLPGRKILIALLKSEFIKTFWHIESKLCVEQEIDNKMEYRAHVHGTHLYYTNEENIEPINFIFRIDKSDGKMTIEPDQLSWFEN